MEEDGSVSSLERALAILHALADSAGDEGLRVSDLSKTLGYNQATTHRILQQLAAGGMVEQVSDSKRYALAMDYFSMAARAGDRAGLRAACRPALVRLGAALGDTVFLLVRAGFDALCLDRWEGPFPVRTFTGDIGGRTPLGVGQGSMVLLAHLEPDERDEVLRYNLPRIRHMGTVDEVFLRTEIARVQRLGYCAANSGLLEGMAGVAVPVFDARGRNAASFSVGTLAARLEGERLEVVVDLLQREARAVAPRINPFDRTLRRPAVALGVAPQLGG